jgi:DNA phosphorothioation-dependent restriction protein DptH
MTCADNIMRYESDVLRKVLLQGREFGTGVILASQYLRHFKVNATD